MSAVVDSHGLSEDHRAMLGALNSWVNNKRICETLTLEMGVNILRALNDGAPVEVFKALTVQVLSRRVTRQMIATERQKAKGEPKARVMKALKAWREDLLRELGAIDA